MRRSFLVAGAALCAACSAIAGLNDDYALGTATAGPDASPDVVAPPGDDGSAPPDGTAPPDAGPPPPFCSGTSIFCTDFEGDASIAVDWTRTEVVNGVPRIVGDAGLDASRALEAPLMTGGATSKVVAWRTVATSFAAGTSIKLRFSFRVHQVATQYSAIGVIQFGGIEHGLAMYDKSACGALNRTCLDENDQSPGHGENPAGQLALDLDVWHVGMVSLTRNADGTYAGHVEVDGHVLDDRATGAMPANADTKNVEVGVGTFFTGGPGTNDVFIDDVLVTN